MSGFPTPQATRIAVVGLGYVGLPLAVEFGKQYDTVGFDINTARVAELRDGRDSTLEVEPELLAEAARLTFTSELSRPLRSSATRASLMSKPTVSYCLPNSTASGRPT